MVAAGREREEDPGCKAEIQAPRQHSNRGWAVGWGLKRPRKRMGQPRIPCSHYGVQKATSYNTGASTPHITTTSPNALLGLRLRFCLFGRRECLSRCRTCLKRGTGRSAAEHRVSAMSYRGASGDDRPAAPEGLRELRRRVPTWGRDDAPVEVVPVSPPSPISRAPSPAEFTPSNLPRKSNNSTRDSG